MKLKLNIQDLSAIANVVDQSLSVFGDAYESFGYFLDGKAEVVMAVLTFLMQGKSGLCKHTDFVELIPPVSLMLVCFISKLRMRLILIQHRYLLKQFPD